MKMQRYDDERSDALCMFVIYMCNVFFALVGAVSRLDEADGSPLNTKKKIIRPDPSLFTFDEVSYLSSSSFTFNFSHHLHCPLPLTTHCISFVQ